jgi:ferredoxin
MENLLTLNENWTTLVTLFLDGCGICLASSPKKTAISNCETRVLKLALMVACPRSSYICPVAAGGIRDAPPHMHTQGPGA